MSRPVSDTAAALIVQLVPSAHPDGGHYRETYRHRPTGGGRGHATLIYYLLQAGEHSHWHRGADVANGEEPQIEIPAGNWQSARSPGLYSLAACLVVPAFEFASFEMAPPGWEPGSIRRGAGARHPLPRAPRRRR